MKRMTATLYDKIADNYDNLYQHNMDLAEDMALYDTHLSKLNISGRVLDLGCGTGTLINLAKMDGNVNYVGIDISPKMVQRAKAKYPSKTFLQDNMECIDAMQIGFFDWVISTYASCSYTDMRKTVKTISNVLRPKGKFFLMLYSERYAETQSTLRNRLERGRVLYNKYSPEVLIDYCRRNGLTCQVLGFNTLNDEFDKLPPVLLSMILKLYNKPNQPKECWWYIVKGEKL